MPWEECTVMDQKLKFIARLLEGEQMAPLCREFGITRPTVPNFQYGDQVIS